MTYDCPRDDDGECPLDPKTCSVAAEKPTLLDDVMANCNDLRRRVWEAEAQAERWQAIATDRTAQIGWMAAIRRGETPETLKWNFCRWEKDIPQKVREGWNKWAAQELSAPSKGWKHIGPEEKNAFVRAIRSMEDPNFHHSDVEKESCAVLRKLLEGQP